MSVSPSYRILRAEHKSYDGVLWRVDIHDSLASAENTRETVLSSQGINLTMEGRNELYDFIHPTTAEFELMITNNDLLTTANSLVASGEQRYYAFIYRESVRVFVGQVIGDTITEEDSSFPYKYTIRAIDGLATLKDQEFSNSGAMFTGRVKFSRLLTQCLGFLPTAGFYDDGVGGGPLLTDYMLHTSMRWYENSMDDTVNKDSLEQSRVDYRLFDKREKNADEPEFMTAWEVLELICKRFAARLFYWEGTYWFVQPQVYTNGNTFTAFRYVRGATDSSSKTTEGGLINIFDNTNTSATAHPKTGGVFNSYKAVREVRIRSYISNYNYLQDTEWSDAANDSVTIDDVDTSSGGLKFKINGRLYVKVSDSSLSDGDIYLDGNQILSCRAKFTINITAGSKYINRVVTGQDGYYGYGPKEGPNWSDSTTRRLEFFSQPFRASGDEKEIIINFSSPEIPNIGTVDIVIQDAAVTLLNEVPFTTQTLPDTIEWELNDATFRLTDTKGLFKSDIYQDTVATNSNSSAKTVLYELPFADAVNDWTPDAIDVLTSTGYFRSSTWNYEGTNYTLNELTAFTYASMQKLTSKVRSGGFINAFTKGYSVLNYLGDNYIPVKFTQNTQTDEDDGDFIVVAEDKTNITLTEEVIQEIVIDVEKNSLGSTFAEDQAIYNGLPGIQTNQYIASGATTSVPIIAATYNALKTGDVVRILNQYTGQSEKLTLTADVDSGDTTMSVSGTLSNDYYPGAYIFLDPEYTTSITPRINNIESANWDGITAAFIDLTTPTNGDLITTPDSDTLTDAQINKRIKVWRNGVKQRYRGDYSGTFTDYGYKIDNDNDRIYFFPELEDEDIEIENIVI